MIKKKENTVADGTKGSITGYFQTTKGPKKSSEKVKPEKSKPVKKKAN